MHTTDGPARDGDLVVLVHGHGGRPRRMARAARALAGRGLCTLNWGYASMRLDLTEAAQLLIRDLERVEPAPARIHFVTHSMGALVARRALALRPDMPVGRFAMVAPPNQGSALARRVLRGPVLRALLGPAACELADPDHIAATCAAPRTPALVIAGTRRFSPAAFNSWISAALRVLPGPGDGTLTVGETRLPHMERFVEISDHHSHLISNPVVIQHIVDFLDPGRAAASPGG